MCKIDGERPLFRIGGILVLDCVVHGVRHPICRLDSRLLELVRACTVRPVMCRGTRGPLWERLTSGCVYPLVYPFLSDIDTPAELAVGVVIRS